MGLLESLGKMVGEEVGAAVGERVAQKEIDKMWFTGFGRAKRRIKKRREEYSGKGATYGEGAGAVGDLLMQLFGE